MPEMSREYRCTSVGFCVKRIGSHFLSLSESSDHFEIMPEILEKILSFYSVVAFKATITIHPLYILENVLKCGLAGPEAAVLLRSTGHRGCSEMTRFYSGEPDYG